MIIFSLGAPSDDVILTNVRANNNNLHGALIENPRSFIKVRFAEYYIICVRTTSFRILVFYTLAVKLFRI